MPLMQNGASNAYGYCKTLIGTYMLEVEPTGQRSRIASGSGHIISGAGGYRLATVGADTSFVMGRREFYIIYCTPLLY